MKLRQRKSKFTRGHPVKTFRCPQHIADFMNGMDIRKRSQIFNQILLNYLLEAK